MTWILIQMNETQSVKEIFTFSCLLQYYSQQPRWGNNLNVHR
jgi:hypothetical protein